jgi:predicted acyltransferase
MNKRWDALDVLRGLTIVTMLLNLSPGSWEHNYAWLVHAPWEGWTLIDMVAPAFLLCVGAAMPLSLQRRSEQGAGRGELARHMTLRALLLVAIGFLLNLYPQFDWETVRIPGVLQRIGLCYGFAGAFMLLTARRTDSGTLTLRAGPIAGFAIFILVSYWALLYFVPVPGFGAPRFDPIGSWPAVIDRAVIGVQHFFPHYRIDGQVVFDPEGILSTWPACFNILLGALAGLVYARGTFERPAVILVVAGALMMAVATLLTGICPLIKNLWTSTFALFSGGFCLVCLGALMPVTQLAGVNQVLGPARIFGENPLLAYVLCFLIAPLIDARWLGSGESARSLRDAGQQWFGQFLTPNAASLAFGICGILAIFAILIVCHRKRWILKL